MSWHPVPGNPEAKAFLALYPTPRAWRSAVSYKSVTLPASLLAVKFNATTTIGEVLAQGIAARDMGSIHDAIRGAAMDTEEWVSPSGDRTIRSR